MPAWADLLLRNRRKRFRSGLLPTIQVSRNVLIAIIVVSAALMALFVAVAVAGNRAQSRQRAQLERRRAERSDSGSETTGKDPES